MPNYNIPRPRYDEGHGVVHDARATSASFLRELGLTEAAAQKDLNDEIIQYDLSYLAFTDRIADAFWLGTDVESWNRKKSTADNTRFTKMRGYRSIDGFLPEPVARLVRQLGNEGRFNIASMAVANYHRTFGDERHEEWVLIGYFKGKEPKTSTEYLLAYWTVADGVVPTIDELLNAYEVAIKEYPQVERKSDSKLTPREQELYRAVEQFVTDHAPLWETTTLATIDDSAITWARTVRNFLVSLLMAVVMLTCLYGSRNGLLVYAPGVFAAGGIASAVIGALYLIRGARACGLPKDAGTNQLRANRPGRTPKPSESPNPVPISNSPYNPPPIEL